ncbi:MAG: SIS domain-containing protein [Actinomycetota bacterium]|nr:SIS domain-containing protein [Actinomycetota bacterium]
MVFDRLNNEKFIYSHGTDELIRILDDFPRQFKKAEKIIRNITFDFENEYKNILILGVGNPATTAYRLIESVSSNNIRVPVSISASKDLPTWISNETLVIAISHSGNTREILNAIDAVAQKGIKVYAITTGGKLKERFSDNELVTIIEYSEKLLPRMSIGYAYVFLTGILASADLLSVKGFQKNGPLSDTWSDIENELLSFTKELLPLIKINDNIAKKLGIILYNNIHVVYGCNKITAVISYRFKTEICATSKMFAHFNRIPEINHDEIEAWEMDQELRKKFIVLLIKDSNTSENMLRRLEILKGIFLEKHIKYEEVDLWGDNELVIAFKGLFLAIWTSLYLAILYEVNPVSIDLIDNIKKRLGMT